MSQGVHFPQPSCKLLYRLGNTTDSSGNAKTLTNYGTVTFPANSLGACGASALFASSGQYLYRATPGVSLSGAWTIRGTIKISEQIGADGDIMTIFLASDGTNYVYIRYSNISFAGGIVLYVYLTTNVFKVITLTVGVPYHLVVTHDGSGNFAMYLNGALIASGNTTQKTTTSNQFWISISTSNENFHGNVDEVMWIAACWTPQQVMRDFAWCKGVL